MSAWPTKAVLVIERNRFLGFVERCRDATTGEVSWKPYALNSDLSITEFFTEYERRNDAVAAVLKRNGAPE